MKNLTKEELKKIQAGLEWFKNLRSEDLIRLKEILRLADLKAADLMAEYLRSADLSGADLKSVDLSDAKLIDERNFKKLEKKFKKVGRNKIFDAENSGGNNNEQ